MFIFTCGIFRKRNLQVDRRHFTEDYGGSFTYSSFRYLRNGVVFEDSGNSKESFQGRSESEYSKTEYGDFFKTSTYHKETIGFEDAAVGRRWDRISGTETENTTGGVAGDGSHSIKRFFHSNPDSPIEVLNKYDYSADYNGRFPSNVVNHVSGSGGCCYDHGDWLFDENGCAYHDCTHSYDLQVGYPGFRWDQGIESAFDYFSGPGTITGGVAVGHVGAGEAGRDPGRPENNLTQQQLPALNFAPPSKVGEVCLPADATVPLQDGGNKIVTDLTLGDVVLVPDENDPYGPRRPRKIVAIYHNPPQPIQSMRLRHSLTGQEFTIRSTPGHRFFVKNRDDFVHAEDIQPGEMLVNGNREDVELLEKSLDPEAVAVYNFQVEEAHTYFVGEDDTLCVLSHNQDCENPTGLTDEELSDIFGKDDLRNRRLRDALTVENTRKCIEGPFADSNGISFKLPNLSVDAVQTAVDLLPPGPWSIITDPVNGAVYLYREKYSDSFMSFIGPFGTALKWGATLGGVWGMAKFVGKHGDDAAKGAKIVTDAAEQAGKHVDEVADMIPKINAGNLKDVRAKDLKKAGIDPHEFKKEYVGQAYVSKFDIKKDPATNELIIVPHQIDSGIPPIPTSVKIE